MAKQHILCRPDTKSNYHITLDDGVNSLGMIAVNAKGDADGTAIVRSPIQRTALKTATGANKYSDNVLPWTPIPQDDWGGGRGNDDFELDATRYSDCYRANTMYGVITHSPQETYTKGHQNHDFFLPGKVSWTALIPGERAYLARKFTPATSYSAAFIYLLIRRRGEPEGDITIELHSDNAGAVGTLLQTATVTTSIITDIISQLYRAAITSQALTASSPYWVKVYSTLGDDENHWEVGVNATAGLTKQSTTGADGTWTDSAIDLYLRITEASQSYYGGFFDYKYAKYMYINKTNSAPVLYVSGGRGVADSNAGALSKLKDALGGWTAHEHIGEIVMLTGGKGSNEDTPWRLITENTDAECTVTPDWEIEHDTTTEYVFLGSDNWKPILDHAMTTPITDDPLVVSGFVYFPLGDAVNIKRYRWDNNAGVARDTWADDGTNKASRFGTVNDSTDGLQVWKANNLDANSKVSVAKATAATSWADLTFGTAITFEDSYGKINKIVGYGSPEILYVLREGMICYISGTKAYKVKLEELRTMMASTNGLSVLINNVYMYLNYGSGIERFLDGALDDVGMNRDEGLPSDRQGIVSSMVGYPARFFSAVDAGSTGFSAVYGYNQTGYCEYYRAPAAGMRIRAMSYQPMPGTLPDRLFVMVGDDVIWLNMPGNTLDPWRDPSSRFTHESVVYSSYYYSGLVDAYKLYYALKVFAESLDPDHQYVEVDYQVDNTSTWTQIKGQFDVVPVKELEMSESVDWLGVNGKRIKLRIRSYTDDNTISPKIKAVVLDNVSHVNIQHSFFWATRLKDQDTDLNGEPDPMSAKDKRDLLDYWATNATPLKTKGSRELFNNKWVFIEAVPLRPIGEFGENYLASVTCMVVKDAE